MTTLTYLSTTLTLPDDLLWADEFTWQPVEQRTEYSITGALLVQSGVRVAGRPITLAAEDAASGWFLRSMLDQIKTWAAVPEAEFTLAYRGANHTVIWRHQDTAVDASPVVFYNDVQSSDFYRATLRFLEV